MNMNQVIQQRSTGSLVDGNPYRRLREVFFAGLSERTLRAYRADLEDFRRWLDAEDIDAAASDLLGHGPGEANARALAYQASLQDRGLQPATINRRLAALRSLVKLARTLGLVTFTLEARNVKGSSYRDTRGPGVTGVRSILETLRRRNDGKGRRDYALVRLLYDMALRRGEVVSLDLEDVDLERGTLAVVGKGHTQRELLTIPEPTCEALAAWLEVRGTAAGRVFTNFDRARKGAGRLTGAAVYHIVRRLGVQVGLKTRPHGLRHTAVTEAVKTAQAHGMGLEEVRDFSRHKDVSTLMIYRDRERNVQGQLAALVAGGA